MMPGGRTGDWGSNNIIGDSPPRLAGGRDSGFRISDFEPC